MYFHYIKILHLLYHDSILKTSISFSLCEALILISHLREEVAAHRTFISAFQVLHIIDLLSNEKHGPAVLGNLGAVGLLNTYKNNSGETSDMVDKIIDKILSTPVEVL